jgi:hypothetical protein
VARSKSLKILKLIKNFTEELHKVIDLILYDIWFDLLRENGTEDNKKVEISCEDPTYKKD